MIKLNFDDLNNLSISIKVIPHISCSGFYVESSPPNCTEYWLNTIILARTVRVFSNDS